tara:strand:+ start:301 stop:945 length:645 start_codon:yes stop_codon:yes gene_type:complete
MVTNTNAPFGFRPFNQQDGASPTAGMDRYFIKSSDTNVYYTGDPVMLSTAAGMEGFLTVPASGSTTGQPLLGIFVGCEYYDSANSQMRYNARFPGSVGSSSPCNAYVITNPQQVFIVQGSTGGVLGSSVINMNFGFLSAQSSLGNTLSGVSAVVLASSTQTANSSFPFRLVDLYANYAPPGVNGTSTGTEGYQVALVRGNNWVRNSGALTATST